MRRLISRSLRSWKSQRGLSSITKSWKAPVFYECSQYTVDSTERGLMERSFNGGCQSFLTRSSNSIFDNYELLVDLVDPEEPNHLEIGHVLQYDVDKSIDGNLETWRKEIAVISEALSQHGQLPLTFLHASLSPKELVSYEKTKATLDTLEQFCRQENLKLFEQTAIGVDCSTGLLSSLTSDQFPQIASTLQQYYQDSQKAKLITIATNYMTISRAKPLIHHLKALKANKTVSVLGTELLRIHPQKPGQISDDYRYLPIHNIDRSSLKEGVGVVTDAALQLALKDFQRATDAVLVAENEFYQKHQLVMTQHNISFPQLCCGMRIMTNLNSIFYPEEWNYLLNVEIEPGLQKQYQELSKIDKSLHEWTILHKPLTRYFFNSLRNVLQERLLLYRDTIYYEYERLNPSFSQGGNFSKEDTVGLIARATKEVAGFDSIGITLTKLNTQDSTYEVLTDPNPLPQAEKFFEQATTNLSKANGKFFNVENKFGKK